MSPLQEYCWDLCDIIQFWLFENLSDASADELERRLVEPPANISPEILADDPIWSSQNEGAMFEAMLAQAN